MTSDSTGDPEASLQLPCCRSQKDNHEEAHYAHDLSSSPLGNFPFVQKDTQLIIVKPGLQIPWMNSIVLLHPNQFFYPQVLTNKTKTTCNRQLYWNDIDNRSFIEEWGRKNMDQTKKTVTQRIENGRGSFSIKPQNRTIECSDNRKTFSYMSIEEPD